MNHWPQRRFKLSLMPLKQFQKLPQIRFLYTSHLLTRLKKLRLNYQLRMIIKIQLKRRFQRFHWSMRLKFWQKIPLNTVRIKLLILIQFMRSLKSKLNTTNQHKPLTHPMSQIKTRPKSHKKIHHPSKQQWSTKTKPLKHSHKNSQPHKMIKKTSLQTLQQTSEQMQKSANT
jgi:hypothetical protein